ncbi:hypothetical protein BsWGS_04410 [Bradybaena similaris]
MKAANFNVERL